MLQYMSKQIQTQKNSVKSSILEESCSSGRFSLKLPQNPNCKRFFQSGIQKDGHKSIQSFQFLLTIFLKSPCLTKMRIKICRQLSLLMREKEKTQIITMVHLKVIKIERRLTQLQQRISIHF